MWHVERTSGRIFFSEQYVGQLGSSELILLLFFIENAGVELSKSDLLEIGWGNKVVAPSSLIVAIANIRKLLSSRDSSVKIKTLHGYGYQFIGVNGSDIVVVEDIVFDYEDNNIDVNVNPPSVLAVGRCDIVSLFKRISFFLLMSISFVFFLHQKFTRCENIDGKTFCSTRTLTDFEKKEIKTYLKTINSEYRVYIYGYNSTAKKMVIYPLR
ncbi:winged helix-turn-helix domain-containing protein [Aeromonas veronii]|uniref:winged helix-turn-helix domain-containing protein n=1 Tax=Aeromonas veronii TaxID=654 RepID=UPI003B9FB54D